MAHLMRVFGPETRERTRERTQETRERTHAATNEPGNLRTNPRVQNVAGLPESMFCFSELKWENLCGDELHAVSNAGDRSRPDRRCANEPERLDGQVFLGYYS
jgi:hypothetical protein